MSDEADDLPPGIEELDKLAVRLQTRMVEREQERLERVEKEGPHFLKLKEKADWRGTVEGIEAFAVKSPMWDELDGKKWHMIVGYCGYALFPKRPVIEPGYHGVVQYVPVHGGITYCEEYEGAVCYGFDTGHFDSSKFPIRDLEWIRGQIAIMINGLIYASSIEQEYLAGWTDERRKAEALQPLVDMCPEQAMNFSVLLNLLCGDL